MRKIAIILASTILVAGAVGQEYVNNINESALYNPCAPEGYVVDWGLGNMCYAPGPTLSFYNGTRIPYCADGTNDDLQCFIYEVITIEENNTYGDF